MNCPYGHELNLSGSLRNKRFAFDKNKIACDFYNHADKVCNSLSDSENS